ncbi:MAG: glycosyltransferase family 4 protein [Parabacteroides sp.]
MKIAFDAKRACYNRTGLGNYSRFVINNLVHYEPDHCYDLYTPGKGEAALCRQIQTHPSLQYRYPQDWLSRRLPALWRSHGLVKELAERKTDLYHGLSNELPMGIDRSPVASIVTIHDLIFIRYPQLYQPIDRLIYRYKFRKACEMADCVIAVSEQTKRDIVSFFHIPEEKIRILYQGCDPVFSQPVAPELQAEVRRKYQLPDSYILYVGSIEERKNLLLLVQAIEQVKEPIHVVAIGRRTAYTQRVEQYIREKGLHERVHLWHQVPFRELPAFYRMATLFVYPSFFEGFGIPIIEAESAGLPVIAATGSCLEEAGGAGALYTDPTQADELSSLIRSVLTESGLADKLRQAGAAHIRRFAPQRLTEELMQIYQQTKGISCRLA